MKRIFFYFLGLLWAGSIFYWVSCIKKDFDSPPDKSNYDPGLPVTNTIAELKDMPRGIVITKDVVIAGTVVMDDRSGNYFKQIVIRDSSGGIAVNIDQNDLYNDYPVGRKIYVRCKGLFLGARHENPELGYTPDATGRVSPIPFPLLGKFIVKANFPNFYPVDTLTIAQLSSPNAARQYLNTIVAIENVEFAPGSAGLRYAQEPPIASVTNLIVEDCGGATINLTSSGYAAFRAYRSPTGKGTLTALYTRYNNTPQLYIRDTSDVPLYGDRCNGSVPEPGALIRIDSLRKLFQGNAINLPALRISGIVISDAPEGNVSAGIAVLQGGNNDRGIILDFGGQPGFNLGDSLTVDITGCILTTSLNGQLEIEGVRADKTILSGIQKNIQPKAVTIAEALTHKDQYESTLIKLSGLSLASPATDYYGNNGNISLTDGTGTITHYCSPASSFKNLPLPPAPITAVTGYLEIHGLYARLRIRYPEAPVNDVIP